MNTRLRMLFAAAALALTASTVHAGISEIFVNDLNYEGGGYFEFTVHNTTGSDVYLVCVGNNDATVIFTRPDLVGQWRGRIDTAEDWDAGLGVFDAGFVFPETNLYPSATYFPGVTQILTYYVLAGSPGGSPVSVGATMSGLRFIASVGGSPYVVFGQDGSVVEQGETVDHPLATEESTWSQIKALYR